MNQNHIHVLVVEPEKQPYAKEIPSSLESLQHEVGGYIQATYPFAEPVALICDEEGKLNGSPLNRALRDNEGHIYDIMAGTFLVVGLGEDHFTSLAPELVQRFAVDGELCDTILVDRTSSALPLLCSETKPDNQLFVRYRRFTLCKAEEPGEPLPGTEPPEPTGEPFELLPDEAFNLQHRDFDLTSRNAGPLFLLGEQVIHPTQVSTKVDYGVYLQFSARRGNSQVPLCAAMPQSVRIAGLDPADVIGIHTYCRDDVLEIIDGRYLTKVKTDA